MYTAFFAEEAEEQLNSLDKSSRNKILKAVRVFEAEGTNAKNSRSLIDGLFEIKADNVRAYFESVKSFVEIVFGHLGIAPRIPP